MDGWVKLHRKLLENPVVLKDGDYLAVWIYLLLNATHKEYPAMFKGEKIMLQPGQLITGRKSICDSLKNISESKVTRIINSFIFEQQIEQQTSNQNRLITIVNWTEYQSIEQPIEQPMNNERTTDEQRVNTNKNVKNVRKKEIIINTYSENEELNKSINDFIEFRKKIKSPMTERAIKLLISELNKLSSDTQEQIEIINQSILKSWKGVFPLKDKGVQNERPRTTTRTAEKTIVDLAREQGFGTGDVGPLPFV